MKTLFDVEHSKLVLKEDVLADILGMLDPNKRTVWTCVIGPPRTGKSFLLNLLGMDEKELRDREGVIGDGRIPFRGGHVRHTIGISVLEEPIMATDESGEEVQIVLLDSQGSFDTRSDKHISVLLSAVALLLSDYIIYNLSQNISGMDLENLNLFATYMESFRNNSGVDLVEKKVQVGLIDNSLAPVWLFYVDFMLRTMDLKMVPSQFSPSQPLLRFLIRNYAGPEFGMNEEFLQSVEEEARHSKELRQCFEHLRNSFEIADCYCLPTPNSAVKTAENSIHITDIAAEFLEPIAEFVRIFRRETCRRAEFLDKEKLRGNVRKLVEFFERSSENIQIRSIVQMHEECVLHDVVQKSIDIYMKEMEKIQKLPSQEIDERLRGDFLNGDKQAMGKSLRYLQTLDCFGRREEAEIEVKSKIQKYSSRRLEEIDRLIDLEKGDQILQRYERLISKEIGMIGEPEMTESFVLTDIPLWRQFLWELERNIRKENHGPLEEKLKERCQKCLRDRQAILEEVEVDGKLSDMVTQLNTNYKRELYATGFNVAERILADFEQSARQISTDQLAIGEWKEHLKRNLAKDFDGFLRVQKFQMAKINERKDLRILSKDPLEKLYDDLHSMTFVYEKMIHRDRTTLKENRLSFAMCFKRQISQIANNREEVEQLEVDIDEKLKSIVYKQVNDLTAWHLEASSKQNHSRYDCAEKLAKLQPFIEEMLQDKHSEMEIWERNMRVLLSSLPPTQSSYFEGFSETPLVSIIKRKVEKYRPIMEFVGMKSSDDPGHDDLPQYDLDIQLWTSKVETFRNVAVYETHVVNGVLDNFYKNNEIFHSYDGELRKQIYNDMMMILMDTLLSRWKETDFDMSTYNIDQLDMPDYFKMKLKNGILDHHKTRRSSTDLSQRPSTAIGYKLIRNLSVKIAQFF